jgi:2',3'-cyclic-nucleotide 2'-phosphodiesterase (5'-nucleotidase family)
MMKKQILILFSVILIICFASCSQKKDAEPAQKQLTIYCMADLHSAYQSFPSILKTIETAKQQDGSELLILINGDIFEQGNVVTQRSGGEIEWAFLERLQALAPVVVNIGNHEGAIEDDLRTVVDRMTSLGIIVLTNILEKGSGKGLAVPNKLLEFDGIQLSLIGMATDDKNTYRAIHRDTWDFPVPSDFADNDLPKYLIANGINIILNHGGLLSDRYLFDRVPPGTLILGGHDHLYHQQQKPGVLAIHTGWWASSMGKITVVLDEGETVNFLHESIDIAEQPRDASMESFITEVEATHLTQEDIAIVAESSANFAPIPTLIHVAEVLKNASSGDVLAINNTTMGAPLRAGNVSQFYLNAMIRFDGGLMKTQINGSQLAILKSLANQHEFEDWEMKTGEYVIGVFPDEIDPFDQYTLVVNGWVALGFNQQRFLGFENLIFQPDTLVPSIRQVFANGL